MKQIVLILMSLLIFSCSSKAQKQTADTDRQSDKRILVAYFSCTGTTEKVATAIAKETGGKLYRITPATAYTSADLDWNDKASRSSVEMADEKSRPALGGETIDLKDYDVVKQLKKLYPKIEWKEGRLFNGGTANVAGWSKQIIEKL